MESIFIHITHQSLSLTRRYLILFFFVVSIQPVILLSADTKSNTPVTSSIKGLSLSPQELRIRVRALIRPVLGILEESADRTIAETSEPAVRRGAIVWKIETTTTMLATLLRSDPVLALADARGYVYQIEVMLKRPDMKALYGPSTARVSEALSQIEKLFYDLVASVQSEEAAESSAFNIRQWAEKNPIKGALYSRPSMDSEVAKMLGMSGSGGARATIENLDETTADVMTRMDLYTMYLPRLTRWEAELAADDLTRGIDPRKLSTEFERLSRAGDRIASLSESAEGLVQQERIAILEGLKRIIDHTFFRLLQLIVIGAVVAALILALCFTLIRRK